VTNHVSFNFNAIPVLATITINDGSNHFGNDNAVSQVSSDSLGLFTIGSLLLGLSELLDESIVSLVDTVGKSTSLSSSKQFDESIHVQFN